MSHLAIMGGSERRRICRNPEFGDQRFSSATPARPARCRLGGQSTSMAGCAEMFACWRWGLPWPSP